MIPRAPTRSAAPRSAPRGARRRGLTLVELILGILITSIIGAAIAAMLFAVSRGTEDEDNLRALVTRGKRVHAASTAALRGCRSLLAADAQRIVLWSRDLPDGGGEGNARIDAAELRVIDFAADANELRWYEPTDAIPDVSYEADADFLTVAGGLIDDGHMRARAWATGVGSFSLTFDDSEPADARLAGYRLTLREGAFEHEAVAAVAMRNR